ncbi:MAG: undecaprenyl-diphosphate phosphatase, partial [Desulfamplus sp.]|nr:undecaprenyl-diphosphate phosphatase [Desulfamplus sp.]
FGYKQAMFIGVCQGIAVVPGISRSGATIAAGLFAGIERETAAKFSFLLSIPAIVGAELLGLKDVLNGDGSAFFINMTTIYGTIIAFVVGYISLKMLLKIVKIGRLHLFAPYCWILGVVTIIAGVL